MDGLLSPHNGMRRGPGPRTAQARSAAASAFSLLEVLTVVAIVGLLAAIAFTATGGVLERGRRSRCRSELAVLAQALEAYRSRFGDYPQTGPAASDPAASAAAEDGPGILFNALAGRRGPGVALVPVEGRGLLPLGAFSLLTGDLPSAGNSAQVANAFLDPWGRRYLYFYRSTTGWIPGGPLLLSAGPDGAVELPADLASWDGILPSTLVNADNLSASAP
jgi:prepilin-type N-terminal cleavage/methylation domain-containing protein